MQNPKLRFQRNAHHALQDVQLRGTFKKAMDGLMDKRKSAFPDEDAFKELQLKGYRIKMSAMSKLPSLLRILESNCQKNGIQVHWAETAIEANQIVLEICKNHKAKKIVKGKSMVCEEIELNNFLEKHDIEPLETDLGEYIVQLAGDKPSHIIAPAIHLNKKQIAKLLFDANPDFEYTEDPEKLTQLAREVLRKKFYQAEIGITGVNFAVAENGALCLVENEGNGRMCTTLPPVHIAVMGIEKVVEKLDQIPILLKLLTRSASGQVISSYFNIITSPRKKGEKDGPREVHLVLLDNGRSKIFSNPQMMKTLLCIRCGACLNHCPVYTRIGGHAYGQVYPGPIGKILTPQLNGLKSTGAIYTASSLCGACSDVCPVKIPIPDYLKRLREEAAQSRLEPLEGLFWKLWSAVNCSPALYQPVIRLSGWAPWGFGPLKKWTRFRKPPLFASKNLHEMCKDEGISND